MILVACAVERELGAWKQRRDLEAIVTGVGPVEAACAVARALAREPYRLVVNAGIAGAFGDAARIGEGVIVANDTFELNLENDRPLVLPDAQRAVETAGSDPELVAALHAEGFAKLRGITVARVTTSDATAARLARLGAQVESMEGFAVLRAAQRAGVPAIELRGISNRVGHRERSGWDFEAGLAGLDAVMRTLFGIVDGAA